MLVTLSIKALRHDLRAQVQRLLCGRVAQRLRQRLHDRQAGPYGLSSTRTRDDAAARDADAAAGVGKWHDATLRYSSTLGEGPARHRC